MQGLVVIIIKVHFEVNPDFVKLSRWVFARQKPDCAHDEYFTTIKMTLKVFLLR